MKRKLALLLSLMLLVVLMSGCSKKDDKAAEAPEETPLPEGMIPVKTESQAAESSGYTITDDVLADMLPEDIATEEGAPAPEEPSPDVEPDVVQTDEAEQGTTSTGRYELSYVPLETFGFSVAYPKGWVNHPGQFTICYSDDHGERAVPPRFTVTKKTLRHTPNAKRMLEQFQTLGAIVKNQYKSDDFEWEEMNEDATFLGLPAYEITYLAYIGETEVKGYMICTAVGMDLYAYHFYCAYKDYQDLSMLRLNIRDSVHVPTEENED